MISAWRIVKKRQAAAAFTGEGARQFGGRWNLRGTAVVYTSSSLALAALELFVHLGKAQTSIDLVCFQISIPAGVRVEVLPQRRLPADWRVQPVPATTQAIGSRWVSTCASAVLQVPSVLIPSEFNLVLNPAHPDFSKLRITGPKPFGFDDRMWK